MQVGSHVNFNSVYGSEPGCKVAEKLGIYPLKLLTSCNISYEASDHKKLSSFDSNSYIVYLLCFINHEKCKNEKLNIFVENDRIRK